MQLGQPLGKPAGFPTPPPEPPPLGDMVRQVLHMNLSRLLSHIGEHQGQASVEELQLLCSMWATYDSIVSQPIMGELLEVHGAFEDLVATQQAVEQLRQDVDALVRRGDNHRRWLDDLAARVANLGQFKIITDPDTRAGMIGFMTPHGIFWVQVAGVDQ